LSHLRVRRSFLTKEILAPFEVLDGAAKWKEIDILDIDFKAMAKLQKYIKTTNVHSIKVPLCELKPNPDVKEIDHLFWNLVDFYADIVIF
jgi:hypothetical protein